MTNLEQIESSCWRVDEASVALAAQYARFIAVVLVVALSLAIQLPGG
jgi:hypothetical protein